MIYVVLTEPKKEQKKYKLLPPMKTPDMIKEVFPELKDLEKCMRVGSALYGKMVRRNEVINLLAPDEYGQKWAKYNPILFEDADKHYRENLPAPRHGY